jgi:hypothetical protein
MSRLANTGNDRSNRRDRSTNSEGRPTTGSTVRLLRTLLRKIATKEANFGNNSRKTPFARLIPIISPIWRNLDTIHPPVLKQTSHITNLLLTNSNQHIASCFNDNYHHTRTGTPSALFNIQKLGTHSRNP